MQVRCAFRRQSDDADFVLEDVEIKHRLLAGELRDVGTQNIHIGIMFECLRPAAGKIDDHQGMVIQRDSQCVAVAGIQLRTEDQLIGRDIQQSAAH